MCRTGSTSWPTTPTPNTCSADFLLPMAPVCSGAITLAVHRQSGIAKISRRAIRATSCQTAASARRATATGNDPGSTSKLEAYRKEARLWLETPSGYSRCGTGAARWMFPRLHRPFGRPESPGGPSRPHYPHVLGDGGLPPPDTGSYRKRADSSTVIFGFHTTRRPAPLRECGAMPGQYLIIGIRSSACGQ